MRCAVLIETSWNVKIKKQPGAVLKSSINRNIVECKAAATQADIQRGFGINRNIVECKEKAGSYNKKGLTVLIETSWNVKIGVAVQNNKPAKVLIETSWNVKEILERILEKFETSINRNIVECKEVKLCSFYSSRNLY